MEVIEQCEEEERKGDYIFTKHPLTRAADYCNVSMSTMQRIKKEYRHTGKFTDKESGNRDNHKSLEDRIEDLGAVLRDFVRQRQIKQKYTTVNDCLSFIRKEFPEKTVSRTSLWRCMMRANIIQGVIRNKKLYIEENPDLMQKREDFLAEVTKNRGKSWRARSLDNRRRLEVYLDESYIWQHHRHANTYILRDEEVNCGRVNTKGNRVIGIYAISEKGAIRDSLVTYECQKRTGDYHGNVNSDVFMKWAGESLFCNLPKHCLIILDNAKYHHTKPEATFSKPRHKMNKADIIQWLSDNSVPFRASYSLPVLKNLMQKKLDSIKSAFETMAESKGHKVVWLPPYHPDYNPIEMVWGLTKREVASQYECDVTMAITEQRWQTAFTNLTDDTVISTVLKSQRCQDEDWNKLLEEERDEYNPDNTSDEYSEDEVGLTPFDTEEEDN